MAPRQPVEKLGGGPCHPCHRGGKRTFSHPRDGWQRYPTAGWSSSTAPCASNTGCCSMSAANPLAGAGTLMMRTAPNCRRASPSRPPHLCQRGERHRCHADPPRGQHHRRGRCQQTALAHQPAPEPRATGPFSGPLPAPLWPQSGCPERARLEPVSQPPVVFPQQQDAPPA